MRLVQHDILKRRVVFIQWS